jgi:hypothetical protein
MSIPIEEYLNPSDLSFFSSSDKEKVENPNNAVANKRYRITYLIKINKI